MHVEICRIKTCEEWPTVYMGHNKYAYEQLRTPKLCDQSLISVCS